MISFEAETILSFGEAARRLPKTQRGTLNPSTIWRWAHRGLKGRNAEVVTLEITKLGGRNYTSVEALQRFFLRLNGPDKSSTLDDRDQLSKGNLSRENQQAEAVSKTLRALGF